jgi:hypothetical protein
MEERGLGNLTVSDLVVYAMPDFVPLTGRILYVVENYSEGKG